MSPKHVLLPIVLAAIVTAVIADQIHPRAWKSAAEASSFDTNSELDRNWQVKEEYPKTLEEDKIDEELLNSYERRGLSEADVSSFDTDSLDRNWQIKERRGLSEADVSSFDTDSQPDRNWQVKEADPKTLEDDEELVNSYERRGLSEAGVSSFDTKSEHDRDDWELNEANPKTLEEDNTDEELVNSYERRGLSEADVSSFDINTEPDRNWQVKEADPFQF